MDRSRTASELLDLVVLVIRGVSGNRDLSLTAVATLGSLDRQGPQRITALAAQEGVSQPSMTQLVQRLEQRGLVSRTADPADGRAALVRLTEEGHAAMVARRERNAAKIAGLLRELPDHDVHALADALRIVLPAVRATVGSDAQADLPDPARRARGTAPS